MNSLLTSIAGQFAKPVILSALLPVVIIASLFLATTYPLFPIPLAMPDVVAKLDASWQVAYGSLMAVLIAMALYVLNGPIARLVSGYPWKDVFPGTVLVRLHQWKFRALRTRRDGWLSLLSSLDTNVPAEDALADRLMDALTPLSRRLNEAFPYSEELVLPTLFGSVIRNAEDYSRQQYGISAVPLWPRLLGAIDARYATVLEDAKTTLDFALNCMVLSAGAALLTLTLALIRGAHGGLLGAALWRVAFFAAVSVVAYAAAVNRAQEWGTYIKAAIDLYRNALLKQLGYTYTLVDIADERERVWSGVASEWSFPDMSASPSIATVPFAAPGAAVQPATQVTGTNNAPLTFARGMSAPYGRPFPSLTVTLRIQNPAGVPGAVDAQDVALRDTMPPNWSFVWGSATSNGAGIQPQTIQPLVFQLGLIAAGATCTVTYRLQSLIATPSPNQTDTRAAESDRPMRWKFWAPLAVEDFPQAAREAAGELEQLGLLRPSTLWAELTPNWSFNPLLAGINARRAMRGRPNLTRAQLAEAVVFIAEQEARRYETPITKRFGQALIVLIVPAMLFVASRPDSISRPEREQVVVIAPRGLPAYHAIAAENDVALKPVAIDPQAMLDIGKVVGHLTMRALLPDQVLHADQISTVSVSPERVRDLNVSAILSIPVRTTDATIAASLPAKVMLLFSEKAGVPRAAAVPQTASPSREPAAPPERQDAYLLALTHEPTGSVATVAVSPDALDKIQPLLSTRDITIVWPAPRESH